MSEKVVAMVAVEVIVVRVGGAGDPIPELVRSGR